MASDNKQIRRKIYRGTGDDEINFIWSEIKKWVMEDRWGGRFSRPAGGVKCSDLLWCCKLAHSGLAE